ncbi:Na+/H+ antiporter NhaC family protein [Alkalicoccus daliensis]|uniref:Transporter, NhaC family n=1 Tax=Alkalicoccus daliensis TaxID=745820 RepID=A0A1H0HXD8_9BACI|nr:Na+/H+ antiporter NhaC family protein [Alkalicoccus daliensis]SDO23809.1 transporter, NhaC family [Alkalicoccus daliensis]
MRRTFTYIEILLIFLLTLLPLMGAVAGGFPLAAAMLPGTGALITITLGKNVRWTELIAAVKKGIYRNRNVAWLLVFIGLLLPTWALAGTIDDLNNLFLNFISPEFFLTAAFLITAVMSITVGSAVGALSIVGIPLMSAGITLQLPEAVVAGALVSGAFVGDRSSPLSSSFQLLAFSAELSIQNHLRTIIPTLLAGMAAVTLIFLCIDLTIRPDAGQVNGGEEVIWSSLAFSFIPPLLLLGLISLGKDMKVCFSSAIAAAGVILLFRGVSPGAWAAGAFSGVGTLNGLVDMLPFVLFILLVGAYCQIIEETEMLQPLLERVFTNTTSLAVNTAQTIGVAAGVSLVSPNQSFPILLMGRSLLPHWKKHFHQKYLSRILADSTVMFAGLVPWSLLAILCSTIVGVPVLYYLPFAVFLWIMPIITLGCSFRKKTPRQEE